jgi:phenolic acid decarboxylase
MKRGGTGVAQYASGSAPDVTPLGFGKPDLRDQPFRTTCLGHRVIEVEAAGLGCALIARRVILAPQEKHPELRFFHWTKESPEIQFAQDRQRWALFNQEVREVDGAPRYLGEDYAFFHRVRAAGLRVECLVDAVIAHDGVAHSLAELFDRRRRVETWPRP